MIKGRSLLIGAGISVAVVILLICGMGAFDVKALSETPALLWLLSTDSLRWAKTRDRAQTGATVRQPLREAASVR